MLMRCHPAGKIWLNLIELIAIKFNLDFVRWKVVCNSIQKLMELDWMDCMSFNVVLLRIPADTTNLQSNQL